LLAAATAATKAAAKAPPKSVPVNIQPSVTNTAALAPQHLTWFQMHAAWLTHGIAGLFLVSAVSLIVLLAAQTTKQEGLSGTLGGRVESAYGRPGMDEQLKRITGVAATFFVICGTILSLTGI
jgi:protein translocase SecG subunit